jgi:hypothetical protein
MRWRLPLTILAAFLMTWGLLQFVWATHEVGLGGEHALDGAANQSDGLRTGISGLVLLLAIGLLSSPPVRSLARSIRERVDQLW